MQSHDLTDVHLGRDTRVGARAQARTAALLAFALGALIIWVVGFSSIEALHNAAHDTRHSNAFPCH